MITASGVLQLNLAAISARAQPGESAAPTSIGVLSPFLNQAHPETDNLIEGWHWDKRTWSNELTDNTYITLPAIWDPTTSGISTSLFQSGIGSNQDLELKDIIHIPSSGLNRVGLTNLWSPIINHGYYYDFQEQSYLYSDDSEIVYLSYGGVASGLNLAVEDGFNTIQLLSIPKIGVPISARQYEWDSTVGKYQIAIDAKKKIQFTGLRDTDGAIQSTYNAAKGEILWDLIDDTHDEFVITYSGIDNGDLDIPELIFNKNYVEEVGAPTTVPSGMEVVGISTGASNEQFNLQFAPVDSTQPISVYSYLTSSGLLRSWTPIPLTQSISTSGTDYQVKVDYDLGLLQFGDPTVSGVNAPPAGHTISANYWKTLRVEYEPELLSDCLTPTEVSVNPIYRLSERGFVYLSTSVEDPASITLEADLSLISLNTYGPLFIGNSFAPVIATVKDAKGQVLEDQTVRFFITSIPSIGSFGSVGTFTRAVTNFNGQARAFYTPPRGIGEIGEVVTSDDHSIDSSPTYSGVSQTTTLHTDDILIDASVDDIFVYQVLVDDPILGQLDFDVSTDINDQIEEYYRKYFIEEQIYGPTGLTAASGIFTTGSLTSAEWEANHRLIWDLSRPSIFAASTNPGRRVLVAELDADALNPHTFTAGAVSPLQPIDVISTGGSEYDVIFDTSTTTMPAPTASDTVPSGTLYGYFVVSPTIVKMQASVFNRRLNRTILSNEISIKLNIPPYLSGLWILDSINQSHIDEVSSLLATITASGQKVPLGFRLRSSNVTLAAALDGITFLDVNPEYNAEIFDLDLVETPGSGVHIGSQVTVSGIV